VQSRENQEAVRVVLLATLATLSSFVPAGAETPSLTPLPGNAPCTYPAEAHRALVGGPVLFTAQIRPNGSVKAVGIRQVPEREVGFEKAVRDCVSKWRFEPASEKDGLRQYDGKIRYRISGTATEEVAIRALLEAFASAWNANSPGDIAALQGTVQDAGATGAEASPSLVQQFTKERAAADWTMTLAPDFDQIRFPRPELAVIRQSFRRRATAGSGSPADGQSSLFEATAIKRGEWWALLGWSSIAGPSRQPTPGGSALDRSVASAVDSVARRLQSDSRLGIPTGTGQDVSGLHFDPQGADFTLWIQRFKDEVYRNWIVPKAFLWGAARGHVDFEFTVERKGSVSLLRLLKSSGSPELDDAAQKAISASRFMALPRDYKPSQATMQVTFVYGN
jgi:TonB family protein